MSVKQRLLQASVGLCLNLFITAGFAHAANTHQSIDRPAPQSNGLESHEGLSRATRTTEPLPPLTSNRDHLRIRHDQPALPQAKSLAATCSVSTFANASGSALVTAVKNSPGECVDALFSITGAQGAQVFPEAKMATIANAMATDAVTYPGNNSGSMLNLVMFLRAGYYIQYYNESAVGQYGSTLDTAISAALNNFVSNSHFNDVNDAHGEILSEFVTLIDSSEKNASHISTLRRLLTNYNSSTYRNYWYMKSAINNVFTVLFRGHYLDDFRAAVQTPQNQGLLDDLVSFVQNNKAADVGSDREYLLQNAGAELSRFLNDGYWYSYPATFHNIVHPKVQGLLSQFSISGYGAGIYIRMAGVIDYYDNKHCSYFGLCNFASDLENIALPPANARTCSPTLKVRSQALTSAQMNWVCNTIAQEEIFFHNKIGTSSSNPVANDFNEQLEMVIFHSSTDYETYAGVLFGIDTNNGGMYLEGDPSVPGNQARFIAYEAEWLRPTFDVWNLTHEYVHYLDGRFIWYGSFGNYPMEKPYSGVWFFEGFGEYMSYAFRNLTYSAAVQEAQNPNKFTLAQLFDTEYSTDYARTYQWGYMAVRFMFERHLSDVNAMISHTRQGAYSTGYRTWLDGVRNAYNNEFREWVICFGSNNGDTSSCGGDIPPLPEAIFKNGFEGDGGNDGGGTVIPVDPPSLSECPGGGSGVLDNDCRISGLSAARSVDREWLTIYVPAGKNTITFTTHGGTGDADLYYKASGWPGDSDFDKSSVNTGNDESITITNPVEGWHYLMLKPKSAAFENVEASAHWQ